MGANSNIEWTHHTFNPWWGCIEVSPACDNCYAREWAKFTGHQVWGPSGDTERRFFADKHWNEPRKWNAAAEQEGERKRVFCASMADVFEQNDQLDPHRARLWALIEETPWLDWLLLTKRPQSIKRMVPSAWLEAPRANVWYGTTVENQHYADQRIPILLSVPAAVRFLSMEPLLGPVNLVNDANPLVIDGAMQGGNPTYWLTGQPGWGKLRDDSGIGLARPLEIGPRINWVITGGESGKGARPANPDWYRSLRDQCVSTGVAFHFKQWGRYGLVDEPRVVAVAGEDLVGMARIGKKKAGRVLDGRTWDELPIATGGAS